MTVSLRLSAWSLALLLPFVVLAADVPAPSEVPNVAGIEATVREGKVVVSWNPVAGTIKKYRIFYSHASILEQGGVYDDYEDAPADVTEYTLTNVPPVAALYVSVLAVGMDDSESPYFIEEARVVLTPSFSSSSSVGGISSSSVAIQSSTLQLLTAQSTSSTGVVLTFTHELSIPERYMQNPFSIKSGSGTPLTIVRYRLEGRRVVLDTAEQMAGRVYQVSVHGAVAGKTPTGELVPQEEAAAPLLFTGLLSTIMVPDIGSLKLTQKGTAVEATWTLPQTAIRALQVQQSSNGGRTFGEVMSMDPSARGVTIQGVTGRQFTLLVRVLGTEGTLSSGIEQTISLTGGSQAASSARTASSASTVTGTPRPTPTDLPRSGIGLAVIVMLSGAATGVRFFRTQNA